MSITTNSELKSIELLKRLNKHILTYNQEFYLWLLDKPNFKEFLINRSNEAHEECLKSLRKGIQSPTEQCNYVLFRGLELNYKDIIEELMVINFPDYCDKLAKLSPVKKYEILNKIVSGNFNVFWKFINSHFSEIKGKLERELIENTRGLIVKIAV